MTSPPARQFRPASVMTGGEAMQAIERIRALTEADDRRRHCKLAHHEARAIRICRAHDSGQQPDAIARAEEISERRVLNILMQHERIVRTKVQPAGAAQPAISGRAARDTAEIDIKWRTHDFAKALLAYHIRHQQVPKALGLSGLIDRCHQFGVGVRLSYMDAAQEAPIAGNGATSTGGAS